MNSFCFKLSSLISKICANGAGEAKADDTGFDASGVGVGVWNFIATIFSAIWQCIGRLIMSLIYVVVKCALNIVDFLQFFVGKLIGIETWKSASATDISETKLENTDIIFKFMMSDTVIKVFLSILGLSIVLLIIFTIIAIVKQEYSATINEKEDFKKGVFLKRCGRSLVLFLTVPIILVFGILGSNAVLAGISSAFNLGSGITLGGQIFVASSYEANRYRTYADNDVRVPVIYKNSVEPVDLDGALSDYVVMNYKPVTINLNTGKLSTDNDYSVDDNDIVKEVEKPYLLVTNSYGALNDVINNIISYADSSVEDDNNRPNEKFSLKGCTYLFRDDGVENGKYKLYLNGNDESYVPAGNQGNYENIRKYIYTVNGHQYLNGCEVNVNDSGTDPYITIDIEYFSELIKNIPDEDDAGNAYQTWTYNKKLESAKVSFDDSRNKETMVGLTRLYAKETNQNVTGVFKNTNSSDTYFGYEDYVALRNEYYVMADVVDYAVETGKELFVVPISYAEKCFYPSDNGGSGSGGTYADSSKLYLDNEIKKTLCKMDATTRGFYVDYGDEIDFYQYSNATNELDGGIFVICTYSEVSKKYIPLTQANSSFKSMHLASSYNGMIVARGLLADGGFWSTEFNPTYIRTAQINSTDTRVGFYSGIRIVDKNIKYGSTTLYRIPGGTEGDAAGDVFTEVTLSAYSKSGARLDESSDETFYINFYTQTVEETQIYELNGQNRKDVTYQLTFYGNKTDTLATTQQFYMTVIEGMKQGADGSYESTGFTLLSYSLSSERATVQYGAAGGSSDNTEYLLSGDNVVLTQIDYIYFERDYINHNIFGLFDINFSLVGNWRLRWGLFHGGSYENEYNSVAYRLEDASFVLDYNFDKATGIEMGFLYDSIDLNVIILVFATILVFQILMKAVWGLIDRIYQIVLLFIVMPGFVSMIPLDDGAKFNDWKKLIIGKVLGAYGVTIGLNIFFIFVPIIKNATQIFELSDIPSALANVPLFSDPAFLNRIVYLLFLLVALTLLNTAPELIAKLVGGEDVVKNGAAVKENVSNMMNEVRDTVSGQKAQKFMKDFKDNAMGFMPGSAFYDDIKKKFGNKAKKSKGSPSVAPAGGGGSPSMAPGGGGNSQSSAPGGGGFAGNGQSRVTKRGKEKPVKPAKLTRSERKKNEATATRAAIKAGTANVGALTKLKMAGAYVFGGEDRVKKAAEIKQQKLDKMGEKALNDELKYQTKIDNKNASIERNAMRMAKVAGKFAVVKNGAKTKFNTAKSWVNKKYTNAKDWVGNTKVAKDAKAAFNWTKEAGKTVKYGIGVGANAVKDVATAKHVRNFAHNVKSKIEQDMFDINNTANERAKIAEDLREADVENNALGENATEHAKDLYRAHAQAVNGTTRTAEQTRKEAMAHIKDVAGSKSDAEIIKKRSDYEDASVKEELRKRAEAAAHKFDEKIDAVGGKFDSAVKSKITEQHIEHFDQSYAETQKFARDAGNTSVRGRQKMYKQEEKTRQSIAQTESELDAIQRSKTQQKKLDQEQQRKNKERAERIAKNGGKK